MKDDDDEAIIEIDDTPIPVPQDLIGRALKLIGPETSRRYWCAFFIRGAVQDIEFSLYMEKFKSLSRTKPSKDATRKLAAALRRVEIGLREFEKFGFRLGTFPRMELSELRTTLEKAAESPTGKLPRMDAERKRLAVAEAYRLLQTFGTDSRITSARDGKFCKLSALLYGESSPDLRNQCKAHIRRLKQGEKSGSK